MTFRDPPYRPAPCPRCGLGLPDGYPGALSRTDNATEICSACGTDEALWQFMGRGLPPIDEWPVSVMLSTTDHAIEVRRLPLPDDGVLIRLGGFRLTGRRIRLVHTDDPYTNLQPGAEGTVEFVDDAGTVHVKWDDGSTLGMISGVDEWTLL